MLRVLVTASPETRARRLSEARELDLEDARKTIKDADSARADYLRRFYGVEVELPTHYDLVVNTDTLSVEQAVDLVAHAPRAELTKVVRGLASSCQDRYTPAARARPPLQGWMEAAWLNT